jgi:hypothetical protein
MKPATTPDVAAELLRHSFRIAALEVEVARLNREYQAPDLFAAVQAHEFVLAMSRELFPLGISTEFERDVEIGESYCVINAVVAGAVEVIVRLEGEWHHRLIDVTPNYAMNYRLSLDLR